MAKIDSRNSKLEIDIALNETFVKLCASSITHDLTIDTVEVTDLCSTGKEFRSSYSEDTLSFDVFYDPSSASQSALEAGARAGTRFPIKFTRSDSSGDQNISANMLITSVGDSIAMGDYIKVSYSTKLDTVVVGVNA